MTELILADRSLSTMPVSVGTAIAIEETILNPKIASPDVLWVNLRTMLRNLMGAVTQEYPPDILVATLVEELQEVEVAIAPVKLTVYYPSYASVTKRFKAARSRGINTDKQRAKLDLEEYVFHAILKLNTTGKIVETDISLPGEQQNAWILTHYPIDLLSLHNFSKLQLLESHTGTLKPRGKWYTKLSGKDATMQIPFNVLTLQVWGDSAMFSPLPIAVRREVLALAARGNWAFTTTVPRMLQAIERLKDRYLVDTLKEMGRVKI